MSTSEAIIELLLFAVPALAEDLFPLASKVPQDVFFMYAGRHNPKAEFLDKAWGEVFTAFHKSGVLDEVWKLVAGKGKAAAREDEDEVG